ncbi:cuticle protein AM1239-like [Eriocheir sinensis]|uniref:cuticle protein AM1239-like n=1 Tax=Eriocheir sinensis TaxID=95602 RepID=UPI0021C8FA77|nr:cuticle protein AM1239-like [Eriocheir sinensis]
MKLVLFSCLLAFAAAAPRPESSAETIVDERSDAGDGNFNYRFETTNGIAEQRTGVPGSAGQSNMQGAYSFTLPDGSRLELTFVADEGGYRPESSALPVAPPVPAHVLETLALVDELVRQGATWDDQGRRITRRK